MCSAFKTNDIFSGTVIEKMAFKTLYKRINEGELLNVVNYYLEDYSFADYFLGIPEFLNEISLISEKIWPKKKKITIRASNNPTRRTKTYCGILATSKGSYTEFHIDPSGSSVYFHINDGHKRFFIIEPTTANLEAYKKYAMGDGKSDKFLNDVSGCHYIDLRKGDTLIMPGGWIHAVYTVENTLATAGNFLSIYDIPMQHR